MKKNCIFDLKKTCNDCKECMICDLDRNKICDNCEKCLGLENDMKEVLIDEILDDTEDFLEVELKSESEIEDGSQDQIKKEWEYIDDVKNLKELVEEVQQGEDAEKTGYHEEYPGLIIKNKKEIL